MAENTTFASLNNMLAKRQVSPVYLLHGEEGYYIDELTKKFEGLIPEGDRDFNLYNLYAPEVDPAKVMDACRRYPMMSDYQVVILKEAQSVDANYMNKLAAYVAHPTDTTVFVICSRGAKAKGKDLLDALKKSGQTVVYESKKLRDSEIGNVITQLIQSSGLNVEPKALAMLRDYVGTDVSRLHNEIKKLTVALPAGAMITPEVIERHIGMSKDFNNFELVAAISSHNELKALRIVEYFRANPKNCPFPPTLSTLFNFFSNLLICQYSKDKSDQALMAACGFKWSGQLRDIREAMRYYNAWHTIEIISQIRKTDTASKGIGSRMDPYDLLWNLVYRMLHPTGRR